ncbi:NAD synthetase [Methanosarcina siciliae T4/M]|uniref:NH(3)-dependent NAD(+) synthetase n=2 Tax=Methanosarcina siciliae TaxID=38027 RepID=A0A0E3PGB7_9EURY|nr:NAD(+) synthase [Methanosarcina siciliae]AKB29838.1 NAD synthetase [Methanosarcina siciliae T4/M]AKB33752.1 NAD synthetase [Methanosarcina siciliae HI350]
MQITESSVTRTMESNAGQLTKNDAEKLADNGNVQILEELNKGIDKLAASLRGFIREHVTAFKKKGVVLGVSGGVDSAVTLTLCVQEFGKEKVYGLLLPEKESAPSSKTLGAEICESLGVSYEEVPISPILEALNIYEKKDQVLKRACPEYDPEIHKTSLILPDFLDQELLNVPYIRLIKDGETVAKHRLKANDYLELIGLQGVKQRSRMLVQYMYAEKMNYVVCGTTNKTEVVLGQYVKYGDGGVDLEPLADCYKTQVYALAKHLGVNESIIKRPPSADTWGHYTTDEEFYWRMPRHIIDQLLYAQERNLSLEVTEKNTGLSGDTIEKAWRHIFRVKDTTEYIRAVPPVFYLDK